MAPGASTSQAVETSFRHRVLAWIADHDDSWVFIVLYVGLGLVLSMTISLFWLVAVVVAHGMLEWYAMRRCGIRDHLAGRVLWHLKLDIGLVLVALWLGLYIDVLFRLAGLGSAARAGAQTAARVIAWQRTIRGVLMTVDEAAHVVKAVAGRDACVVASSHAAPEDGRRRGRSACGETHRHAAFAPNRSSPACAPCHN